MVIFTSDNGGLSTSEGAPTSNLPYRAGKGWLYEGGIREPFLVRWPRMTPKGATTSWPVTSTDIYPTILQAAGVPVPKGQHVDGRSFFAAMEDPSKADPERVLFWHYPHWGNQGGMPGAAVRRGDWKLIHWFWGKPPELFHLGKDPGERENVAEKNPEVVVELEKLLAEMQADTKALMPVPNQDAKEPFDKW
jgi:arylsulfatase A-like enzyme